MQGHFPQEAGKGTRVDITDGSAKCTVSDSELKSPGSSDEYTFDRAWVKNTDVAALVV